MAAAAPLSSGWRLPVGCPWWTQHSAAASHPLQSPSNSPSAARRVEGALILADHRGEPLHCTTEPLPAWPSQPRPAPTPPASQPLPPPPRNKRRDPFTASSPGSPSHPSPSPTHAPSGLGPLHNSSGACIEPSDPGFREQMALRPSGPSKQRGILRRQPTGPALPNPAGQREGPGAARRLRASNTPLALSCRPIKWLGVR